MNAPMPQPLLLFPGLMAGGRPLPRAVSCLSVEYYTPPEYIQAARAVMGGIDCDPASNDIAQRTVQAGVFYTKETNGLSKPWPGRVFMNPPYGKTGAISNQARWSARLIESYQAGITHEAILLVNAACDTRWFQALLNYPMCLPVGRIDFTLPDGKRSHAVHASALVYLGPHEDRFYQVFCRFGRIVRAMQPPAVPTLWEEAAAAVAS